MTLAGILNKEKLSFALQSLVKYKLKNAFGIITILNHCLLHVVHKLKNGMQRVWNRLNMRGSKEISKGQNERQVHDTMN